MEHRVKIKIKGVYSKTKKLDSGQTRTYFHDQATGAALPEDPTAAEFHIKLQQLRTLSHGPRPPSASSAIWSKSIASRCRIES